MPWYGVRSVYLFYVEEDGSNVFEERVVCFLADSWPEARQLAVVEAEAYSRSSGAIAHIEFVGYEQDGEPLVSGSEVWSELYDSKESLEEFYKRRYRDHEHRPRFGFRRP